MMGAAVFLSMWMNNTASTSIMLPVALVVVHELGIYSENFLNRQQAAVINGKHDWKYESIAKWTPLAQSTSWDSILLLGAGLTIATAFEVTSSGIHPAFLIFPCTLAVSLAFMLPIATPPSAIVFASGAIRVIDMMSIIFCVILYLSETETDDKSAIRFDSAF
ncbi:unnamed protein product [Rotaria magnacalcarata]|uniref:Uncharacterized protein n=1 Tax=Rotaria magnacalcarata TaxID=392030 RepID=A0A816U9Z3_9BILA|nr:unnamed protein product [Rotaria magnacalcarata]